MTLPEDETTERQRAFAPGRSSPLVSKADADDRKVEELESHVSEANAPDSEASSRPEQSPSMPSEKLREEAGNAAREGSSESLPSPPRSPSSLRVAEKSASWTKAFAFSLLNSALRHTLTRILPEGLEAPPSVQVALRKRAVFLRDICFLPRPAVFGGCCFRLLQGSIQAIEVSLLSAGKTDGVEEGDTAENPTSSCPVDAEDSSRVSVKLTNANFVLSFLDLSEEDASATVEQLVSERRRRRLEERDASLDEGFNSRALGVSPLGGLTDSERKSFVASKALKIIVSWLRRLFPRSFVYVQGLHVRVEGFHQTQQQLLPSWGEETARPEVSPFLQQRPLCVGVTASGLAVHPLREKSLSKNAGCTDARQGVAAAPEGAGGLRGVEAFSAESLYVTVEELAVYVQSDELLVLHPHTRTPSEVVFQMEELAASLRCNDNNPSQEGVSPVLSVSGLQVLLRKKAQQTLTSEGDAPSTRESPLDDAEVSVQEAAGLLGGDVLASELSAAPEEAKRRSAESLFGPAVAGVEVKNLNVEVSPLSLRVLDWLLSARRKQREAVFASERVRTFVTPFKPSCKGRPQRRAAEDCFFVSLFLPTTVAAFLRPAVKGNSRIWWRFAVNALRRLSKHTYTQEGSAFPGQVFSAEEVVKIRLLEEDAQLYRRLRTLELLGRAKAEERRLLSDLRETLPLPLLLKAHAASKLDARGGDQEEQTDVVSLKRRGRAAKPSVPPLPLASLLERLNRERLEEQAASATDDSCAFFDALSEVSWLA